MNQRHFIFAFLLASSLVAAPSIAGANVLEWRIEVFVNNVSQGSVVASAGVFDVDVEPGDTVRFVVGFSGTPSENTSRYLSFVSADDPAEIDYAVGSGNDLSGLNFALFFDPDTTLNDGTPATGNVNSELHSVSLGTDGDFYEIEYLVQAGLNRDAAVDFYVQGVLDSATGQDSITGTAEVRLNTALPPLPASMQIIDASGDGAGNPLAGPLGIAADGAGNVYVTGRLSYNAFKITSGGVITEIIDTTGDGAGHLLGFTSDIAVDGSGNVYVSGQLSDNVFKITPGGVITEIIGATGDGGGNILDGSTDIAVDGSGNVYVIGSISDNAFRIGPMGISKQQIIDATGDGGGNVLDSPGDIALDAMGNVYVSGQLSDNVFKITPGGVITEIIDATGDGGGNILDLPNALAVNASGDVFVTGADSNNAFKITPGGVITEIIDATGAGGGVILDTPGDIVVDRLRDVYYVSGAVSDNVLKIAPGGVITEVIDATGDGAGNPLEFAGRVALDGSGNIYVSGYQSDNAFKIAGPPAPVPALSLLGALIALAVLAAGVTLARRARAQNLRRA